MPRGIQSPQYGSLFFKIFAWFWLIIALVVATLLALPYMDGRESREMDQTAQKVLQGISHRLERGISNAPYRSIEYLIRRAQRNDHHIFLLDRYGNISSLSKLTKTVHRFIVEFDDPQHPMMRTQNEQLVAGPVPINIYGEHHLLYISRSIPNSQQLEIFRLLHQPKILFLITLLVSAPLCLILAWHLTQPLRQLQRVSTDISNGHLDTPVPQIHRSDEIGSLANSFEQMVEAIRSMITRQQRLLGDISHELRSPLTRLKMATALAKRKHGSNTELTRIETEAERLEDMIAALLRLSRQQLENHEREPVTVAELVGPLLSDATFEAEQLHKRLRYPELARGEFQHREVHVYPEALASAIENVVRNALKYAKETVSVELRLTKYQLQINVEDDGVGVHETEMQEIFRPFYRVGEARDRSTGGAGLGLAIASNAVQIHQGEIQAYPSKSGGLGVQMVIPVKPV